MAVKTYLLYRSKIPHPGRVYVARDCWIRAVPLDLPSNDLSDGLLCAEAFCLPDEEFINNIEAPE